MRSKRAVLNIAFALLYEVVLITMGIIVPRLIIQAYGSDVNGLTSTINNVLTVLNLIQAGAVGASIFQMLKPVAEKDYETQGRILGSSRLYFFKIGVAFLVLIVISAPVLAMALDSGTIGFWEKIIAFSLLGVNGSLSFFFVSNYDILFSSNQKRFVLSIGGLIDRLVYYSLLFTILFLKLNFLLMYLITLISTFFKIIFLYLVYRQTYKRVIKLAYSKGFRIPNKGYLMCNQIARQSIDGSPTIIVSVVYGLGLASVYSIYNLVFNIVKTVSSTFQTSISELFGNVVVSDKKEKVKGIYDLLNYLFFAMSIILCGCTACLLKSFIFVYTDGNTLDINYVFRVPALLFAVAGAIFVNYHPIYTLSNVLGYYKDTYLQSLITAILAIGIAIGLSFLDWALVVVGLIVYFTVSYIYRTIVVYKKTGKDYISLSSNLSRLVVSILFTVIVWYISDSLLTEFVNSWLWWLVIALIAGVSSLLFVLLYSLIFEKKQLFASMSYLKSVFRRKPYETISDGR